ncbi:MAG: alanine--tRNA ligase, partial [Deltaproteobacteria bacterium]|nr:alanine--tRNA ligase [Deltaproteobacteria bacterium]
GMNQFKAVFLNEEKKDYTRAVTVQKCMRAGGKHNDLEHVGRTGRHHTFFEMLGNFSFGGYFKNAAIDYAWEFLTKVLRLDPDRLYVTIFEKDDEAEEIWGSGIGVPRSKIVRMGEKDNFWSMGDTGPCGPCSEIIIDQGADVGCKRQGCAVGCDCDRFLELWNLVFMQYNRDVSGMLMPLPNPCIDTGMGLERLTAVIQSKHSNYETDIFMPLINYTEKRAGLRFKTSEETDMSMKAVADHARAAVFLISDGITPSNEGRGYVLRRIIRRAARHAKLLGIKESFLFNLCGLVAELMESAYPELEKSKDLLVRVVRSEEERFFETLERGLELLEEELSRLEDRTLSGEVAFKLYDTYGFPLDLTADIARAKGIAIDEHGFQKQMDGQKEKARRSWKGSSEAGASEAYRTLRAREIKSEFVGYDATNILSKITAIIKDGRLCETATEGDEVEIVVEKTPFYAESGGQVGDTGRMDSDNTSIKINDTKRPYPELIVHSAVVEKGSARVGDAFWLVIDEEKRNSTQHNHSATHILHAVLRKRLGGHIRQAGSLVGPDGLRFDFSHFEPINENDLAEIEKDANRAGLMNIEVKTEVIPYNEAIEKGALAFFDEKYGDSVRMVSIEGVSKELCGGTHAKRTGGIGLIKITSECSVAAGVRRIEAITGITALDAIVKTGQTLKEAAYMLKSSEGDVPQRIKKLLEQQKELQSEIAKLKNMTNAKSIEGLKDEFRLIGGVKVVSSRVDAENHSGLREMADRLRLLLGSGVIILGSVAGNKALLLAAVTKDLTSKFSAGEIIKRLSPIIGGKGGGKADIAEAGGTEVSRLDEAIRQAYEAIAKMAANI